MLQSRNLIKKAKELVLCVLRDDGINCGGQEMTQDMEDLKFWKKKKYQEKL